MRRKSDSKNTAKMKKQKITTPVISINEFRRLEKGTAVIIIPFFGSLAQHDEESAVYQGVRDGKHTFFYSEHNCFRANTSDLAFTNNGNIVIKTAGSCSYLYEPRVKNTGGTV